MRNTEIIPLTEEESLVIASDNSGGIGEKESDQISVPYDLVAYYAVRVALMECMSAHANPISVVAQNFCGNEAWFKLMEGIKKGLAELGLAHVSITGSSESNFNLSQSAVGITVIGKRKSSTTPEFKTIPNAYQVAIIGSPLVGDEVILESENIVPLNMFKQICQMENVVVWPVGSKGIHNELERIYSKWNIPFSTESELNLYKSSGPSTCFIAIFPKNLENEIQKLTGQLYHAI